MCLEHKSYWECCLRIDNEYTDQCPLASIGKLCDVEERVHPVGGYCIVCRMSQNKAKGDTVTSPMYTRSDSYDRPWETQKVNSKRHKRPPKYKPVKSQPLTFPTNYYSYPPPTRQPRPKPVTTCSNPLPKSVATYSYYHSAQTQSNSPPAIEISRGDRRGRYPYVGAVYPTKNSHDNKYCEILCHD